jgi:hypothetical protein
VPRARPSEGWWSRGWWPGPVVVWAGRGRTPEPEATAHRPVGDYRREPHPPRASTDPPGAGHPLSHHPLGPAPSPGTSALAWDQRPRLGPAPSPGTSDALGPRRARTATLLKRASTEVPSGAQVAIGVASSARDRAMSWCQWCTSDGPDRYPDPTGQPRPCRYPDPAGTRYADPAGTRTRPLSGPDRYAAAGGGVSRSSRLRSSRLRSGVGPPRRPSWRPWTAVSPCRRDRLGRWRGRTTRSSGG